MFCEICAKMSIAIWTENENKIGGQMPTEGRNNIITLSRTYNGFDIYFMAGKKKRERIQISTTDPGLG